tara:strand:+ start:541 stop:840 length:300 start_codon:yes stop_codon:yes gene_type:complete
VADINSQIAQLSDSPDHQVITIDSDADMRFIGGDYIEEGTEVEVHCLVSYNELDERESKIIPVVGDREVEIGVELLDLVKAQLLWVPDAAEQYADCVGL